MNAVPMAVPMAGEVNLKAGWDRVWQAVQDGFPGLSQLMVTAPNSTAGNRSEPQTRLIGFFGTHREAMCQEVVHGKAQQPTASISKNIDGLADREPIASYLSNARLALTSSLAILREHSARG